MDNKISRLNFLQVTGKMAAAVVLSTLLKFVPEAQPVLAANSKEEFASVPHLDEIDFKETTKAVKATREFSHYKNSLSSQHSFDYWVDQKTGMQFVSFIVNVPAYARADAFNKASLYLFPFLTFALDSANQVVDVFLLNPDASRLDGTSNLTSTLKSLREGTTQIVEHKDVVSEKVRNFYQASKEAIAKLGIVPGARLSNPLCDCGKNLRRYCSHTTKGGGFVDGNCQFICSLGCQFVPNPAGKVACLVACRAACWVPAYSYCDTYSCSYCCSSCS